MAATKKNASGRIGNVRVLRRDRGNAPTVDVAALFEDTMRRYPKTMARLAE